ncbi:MAG: 3-methylornithyl-N6-L-lysine dehydrogenase PylD [Euryarchaeota archaeon]|nr:3-methylornithyl-N6-L-lysine dehydrogenase PylD [Euryarchaeota archaeon]
MTRLTPSMIYDVPYTSIERDNELIQSIGLTLKDLAYEAVGLHPHELNLGDYLAAAVPVTSGKGMTEGFSESVCSIVEHLGMQSMLTRRTDVAGLSDALAAKADIIFMADDDEFIALNAHTGNFSNNTHSTALGYFTAFRRAAGSLRNKDVLLIGAGRIGNLVGDMLAAEQAYVTVVDKDITRSETLCRRHDKFTVENSLEKAMQNSKLIFNASPAKLPGEWITEGAIISSPGVPFSFDKEGFSKVGALIHDPLQIGVSVMALWSASLSSPSITLPLHEPIKLEVSL